MPEKPEDKFEYFPKIEGASVPLRRHVDQVYSDGSILMGREEFGMAAGDGEVDGVKFDVKATMGCNLEVQFRPKGATDGSYRYYLSIQDMVWAAHEQFKRDRKRS